MEINGTKAQTLNALYENGINVTSLAAQLGVYEAAVYKVMRLWCQGGAARHQAPRGQQVRRIIKELNRHIRQAQAIQTQRRAT